MSVLRSDLKLIYQPKAPIDPVLNAKRKSKAYKALVQQIVPIQRPMTDKQRNKAMAYIKKYESRPQFKNFEKRVVRFIKRRASGQDTRQTCGYSFIEFVLLEVRMKNFMNSLSKSRYRNNVYDEMTMFRCECRINHDAGPRWHGKIYRELINRTLAEVGMLHNFPLYFTKLD